MCTEQNPSFAFGVVGTDDVAGFQYGVVIRHEVGILVVDFGSEGFKLTGQKVTAGFVSCGVGHTRPEVGLNLNIVVGTVGIEGRHVHGVRGDGGFGAVGRFITFVAACHCCYDQQHKHRDEGVISLLHCSVLKFNLTSFLSTVSSTSAPFIRGTFMLT